MGGVGGSIHLGQSVHAPRWYIDMMVKTGQTICQLYVIKVTWSRINTICVVLLAQDDVATELLLRIISISIQRNVNSWDEHKCKWWGKKKKKNVACTEY